LNDVATLGALPAVVVRPHRLVVRGAVQEALHTEIEGGLLPAGFDYLFSRLPVARPRRSALSTKPSKAFTRFDLMPASRPWPT
jgi:hypothetical protein